VRTVLGRRLIAIVAFIVLALAALGFVELNVIKGLSWSVSFATVATLVLTVVIAAIVPVRKLLGWARGTLPIADTTLDQARQDLAQALAAGWGEEERLRRINDPWPLPVHWSGPDAGQFSGIGRVFAGLPSHRLVILGPAGAGKTALAIKLVRELLQARQPSDPVPVLLSAATWTDSCTMTEWVARQLTLDHPGLAVRVRTGTDDAVPLAQALAISAVLPVIDGLDELPEGRRAEVVAEVNAHGSDSPIVLTSRPEEYEAATVTRPLTLASVIRLLPLGLADVQAYLQAATDAPTDRWNPVFEAFDANTDAPLTEVLTNPLMLWLARTVYEQGSTQPGELTDRDRFPDRDAIERHLLAGFVPAAYAPRSRKRGFRCSSEQAERWLGFLAARQGSSDSQDIAWWRLCLAEPGWSVLVHIVRVVLYTCVAWWALSWALTQRGYWHGGTYTGHDRYRDLFLAGPLGQAVRPVTGPFVRVLPPGFDKSVDSFVHLVAGLGLAQPMIVAAGVGFLVGLFLADQSPTPQMPRARFVTFRSAVFWFWVRIAVLAYVWWRYQVPREPILAIASGWRTQLVLIWIGIVTVERVLSRLAVSVDVSSAAGSAALLRGARWVYLLRCVVTLASVASVWLWAGTAFAAALAMMTVAGFVIVAVMGGSAGGAYPRYLEARFRLSARGRLPWRTMSFLTDAHQRGVLRQVGAVYQFRHIRLQEQLARDYSPWPPQLGVVVDAWTQVQGRIADWHADPQVIAMDPETVSGVIAPTSPRDCVRRQLTGDPLLAVVGALVAVVGGVIQWYFCFAGLFLIGAVLVTSCDVRLRRRRAGLGLIPRSWSSQATSGGIHVSQDDTTMFLAMSDIERVRVLRVRNPDGSPTEWTALHARLRPELEVPFPTHNGWLPLAWLTTNGAGSGDRKLSQLQVAVSWFPDPLLARKMARLRRRTAIAYSASGVLEEPPAVPWLNSVVPAFVVSLVLVGFGQDILGVVCAACGCIMMVVCESRLDRRRAMYELPRGPWSVRITAECIDLEVNGVLTHLTPDDVAEIELRALLDRKGKRTVYSIVQLRSRTGVTAPYLTQDGWLPLHFKLLFVADPPTDLIAALHRFAGNRFGARLALSASNKSVGRAEAQ
jgi:hypothetical protein